MKVPKISVQYFPNRNITSQIPSFVKKSIEQELGIIKYHFKTLFEDIKIPELDVDSDILKSSGIFKIGRNLTEGIGIVGKNYNYSITCPEADIFKLYYLNKITGDPERIITINKGEFLERTKLKQTDFIDENIEEALQECDSNLIKLKQKVLKTIPQPYIPTNAERETLDSVNQVLRTSKTITRVSDAAKLDEPEMEMITSILDRYKEIKDAFKKFNNPTTASNVRTYYKNYNRAESNSTTMSFRNIGPNNENITTSFIVHGGKPYTVIKVSPNNDMPFAFVISSDGVVQKNLPFVQKRTAYAKKRKDSVPDFYDKEELKSKNIKQYLDCVNEEFIKYRDHAVNWRKQQLDFVAEHTNVNVGSTKMFTRKIDNIFNSIENLKGNIRKHYEYLAYSDSYLRSKNINIEFSRRGVRFEKITPEKYDLRLTFPSLQGKRVAQILVMNGDNIKESFYIIDEKLLKLDFKHVNTAFIHADRQRYYYPQKYIDNSRLGEYIDLMGKYLNRANRVMMNKPPES